MAESLVVNPAAVRDLAGRLKGIADAVEGESYLERAPFETFGSHDVCEALARFASNWSRRKAALLDDLQDLAIALDATANIYERHEVSLSHDYSFIHGLNNGGLKPAGGGP